MSTALHFAPWAPPLPHSPSTVRDLHQGTCLSSLSLSLLIFKMGTLLPLPQSHRQDKGGSTVKNPFQ